MAQVSCSVRWSGGFAQTARLGARQAIAAAWSGGFTQTGLVRRKAALSEPLAVDTTVDAYLARAALLRASLASQFILQPQVRSGVPATTTERFSVDGEVLNTLTHNIETLSGRMTTPGVRTSNVTVPLRHGAVHTLNKSYDQASIALPMWVGPANPDGTLPDDPVVRERFFTNLEALAALFSNRTGLLELKHVRADGRVRYAYGEVLEAIDFTIVGPVPVAKFSVAMTLPDPFWFDAYTDFAETGAGASFPYLLAAENLAGGSAPIEDAVFRIDGPFTNPTAESYYNGAPLSGRVWFTYGDHVPDGQSLTVDCGTWTLTGSGGLVPDYAKLTHAGSARWMVLHPGPSFTAPQVRITGSETGANTKFRVDARRKYLLG